MMAADKATTLDAALEESLAELRAARDKHRSARLAALRKICEGVGGLGRTVEAVVGRLAYLDEAGDEADLQLLRIVLEAQSGGKTAPRPGAARLASLMRSMTMNMELVEAVGWAMQEWAAAMQETMQELLKPDRDARQDRELVSLVAVLLKRSDALVDVKAGWQAVEERIKKLSRQQGRQARRLGSR